MSRAKLGALVVGVAVLAFGLGAVLFRVEGPPAFDAPAAEEVWTCSMHPQIRNPGPGSCPICGMDLVPASSIEASGTGQVVLSERAKVLARIRTSTVERIGEATAESRELVGRVEVDESRMRTVTAWVGGRIDRLQVRETGAQIRRGQTIATLYSPEVYSAHQDLLVAKRQVERLASASELARSGAMAALEAARDRLRLLGYDGVRLQRLEQADRPSRSVAIRADAAGTVLERIASQGAYVQPGAALYRVADLSSVWVQLDAYERDLPALSVGRTVQLSFTALPGQTLEGTVTFVDPVVDAQRRTARVRVEVDNNDGMLRPGMAGTAIVSGVSESGLVIPASAPLFTGRRSLVYVEETRDPPTYTARTVQLGPRTGEVFPVIAGLEEGERVVTHGAFAVDAELQLRGGSSMMTRADDRQRVEPSDEFRAALAPVVEAYLDLAQQLAADSAGEARAAAERIHVALADLHVPAGEQAGVVDAWTPLSVSLMENAHHVTHAPGIAGMRVAFEHLSDLVRTLLRRLGNPTNAPIHEAFCPMAFDNRGAHWLQREEEIANAYFGANMLTCGSIEATVAPKAFMEVAP